MEKWKEIWRRGLLPQMPVCGLEALLIALETEKDEVLGEGTIGVHVSSERPRLVRATAPWLYPFWLNGECPTEDLARLVLRRVLVQCDRFLGKTRSIGPFIEWWENGEGDTKREQLAREVRFDLDMKAEMQAG